MQNNRGWIYVNSVEDCKKIQQDQWNLFDWLIIWIIILNIFKSGPENRQLGIQFKNFEGYNIVNFFLQWFHYELHHSSGDYKY